MICVAAAAQALQEDGPKLDPVAEALARLVVRMPDRLLPKMHFEGDFCVGCDWRRINLTESSKVGRLTTRARCNPIACKVDLI